MLNGKEIALKALLEERAYQDDKHGDLKNCPHSIGEWILILEAELSEAKEACIKGGKGRDSVLSEIVQVCAVAFACIEQHGIVEIEKRSV